MSHKTALGLLIGDTNLELLELVSLGGKLRVLGYSWMKLPEGLVRLGRVIEPQILGEKIKWLMANAQPKAVWGEVVVGLPQSQVFIKAFMIPKFEERELNQAINWHVESLGPILPQEAYTSYEIIGKGEGNEVKVLAVAAAKSVVDGYIEALDSIGVNIQAIEPLAIAEVRLIDLRQLLDKNVVSVHLYSNHLAVSILVSGKLWFSKELLVKNESVGEIRNIVAEVIKYFFERKEKDIAEVSEIIYSGDIKGMEQLRSSLIGFNIKVGRAETGVVFSDTGVIKNEGELIFAPILGLAMRGRMHQKGWINLLPDWPKEKFRLTSLSQTMAKLVMMAGLTIWLTVMVWAATWLWMSKQQPVLIDQKQRLTEQLHQEEEVGLLEWEDEFNNTVESISLIEDTRVNYSQILSSLAELMPATIRLTTFAYNSRLQQWSLGGVAQSREDVLGLDQALKQSERFKTAKLYFSSLQNNEEVIFRFSGGDNE